MGSRSIWRSDIDRLVNRGGGTEIPAAGRPVPADDERRVVRRLVGVGVPLRLGIERPIDREFHERGVLGNCGLHRLERDRFKLRAELGAALR